MRKPILIIFMVLAFLIVSNDDHEIEVQEDAHWCQQIKDKVWYASQDEIERRCGE